ncbi:hypothetical protein MHYP_G00074080 [Metynnis hypsauchen]
MFLFVLPPQWNQWGVSAEERCIINRPVINQSLSGGKANRRRCQFGALPLPSDGWSGGMKGESFLEPDCTRVKGRLL